MTNDTTGGGSPDTTDGGTPPKRSRRRGRVPNSVKQAKLARQLQLAEARGRLDVFVDAKKEALVKAIGGGHGVTECVVEAEVREVAPVEVPVAEVPAERAAEVDASGVTFRQWLASPDGQDCLFGRLPTSPSRMEVEMERRLELAFRAGRNG